MSLVEFVGTITLLGAGCYFAFVLGFVVMCSRGGLEAIASGLGLGFTLATLYALLFLWVVLI